jgi:branched-chain amino acid transport system ATP-binding protein
MTRGTLTLTSVAKRFGGVLAVSDISLQLPDEALIGLMGPNGSGKSTLFHLVAGFHAPNSGAIVYEGRNIAGLPPHAVARRGIVRVFQNRMVFDDLSVRENVAIALRLSKSSEDPDRLLDFVGLAAHRLMTAKHLPYGQARKLAIAIALGASPKMLLLDEPAAGLTITEAEELALILRRICDEKGQACWIIEHDMRFLMSLVAYIFVMDAGRLIAQGTPAEVRQSAAVRQRYLG